jgi:hypothetical protein
MTTMTKTTGQPAVDLDQVRGIVDRAVKAAVPASEMVERRIRPESEYSWPEPRPLAGVRAALAVARMAQDQAYKFAKALRGEGSSWATIADLLEIPWSEEYARQERAYELVAGVAPGTFSDARVYWTCAGRGGCGQYVTDHGPYNGYPVDNERGHADGCRRLAAENAAYEREREEREERARVMDEAMAKVTDSFGQETVKRARYVQSHGGRYLGWSTSESLAVALVLRDTDQMKAEGYSTQKAALARVMSGMSGPASPDAWLRLLRAAATGVR